MKILTLHSNYVKFKAVKKAIKQAEEVSKDEKEFKDCLVVLTAVEKIDETNPENASRRLADEVKDVASKVKTNTIVLYPYAHLSSDLASPDISFQILKKAELLLKKNFKVARAPFGHYKEFTVSCKGHPLAELSREFGPEVEKHSVEEKFSLTKKTLSEKEKINLTAAALVGKVIKELYPESLVGLHDLSYDQAFVDISGLKLSQSHISQIEKKVNALLGKKLSFKKGSAKEKYQKEILNDLGNQAKAYSLDKFTIVPIYKNPYISLSKIKAIKIFNLASAYWRGSSDNPQLTRVYCSGFSSEKELKKYVQELESADNKSHRVIGEKLGIFTQFDKVGKGLPIWLPNGEIVKKIIEDFAVEMEDVYGYKRVSTPVLAKKELFEQSGHLPYYKDSMYPPMQMDDGTYYLKAMNCPSHHLIYAMKIRSYRDLPFRIAEYGLCYRNELSGTLTGLQRVRSLEMNDAHIYCRKDQIESEVESVLKMVKRYYKIFNFKDYWFRLSLSDLKTKGKFIDEPENWKYCEKKLRLILKRLKLKFVEAKGEAAFYGPKIDIQFRNVYGREDTMSTIQLDFLAKQRFNLNYVDESGKKNKEVFVIHRAPLSTHERFIAFLLEHFEGKFPLWLSPVQVKILTVTDRNIKFAREVYNLLTGQDVRTELDDRHETIGKKVREAQLDKVNYIVTIGDKEVDKKTLAVRSRSGEVKFGVNVDSFLNDLLDEIDKKEIK